MRLDDPIYRQWKSDGFNKWNKVGRRERMTGLVGRTEQQRNQIRTGALSTGRPANGHPDVILDDTLGDGVTGEAGDVMDIELVHQVLAMFIHRFEGHAQLEGNLFVGLAFSN